MNESDTKQFKARLFGAALFAGITAFLWVTAAQNFLPAIARVLVGIIGYTAICGFLETSNEQIHWIVVYTTFDAVLLPVIAVALFYHNTSLEPGTIWAGM